MAKEKEKEVVDINELHKNVVKGIIGQELYDTVEAFEQFSNTLLSVISKQKQEIESLRGEND